jgi:hypothetical protein
MRLFKRMRVNSAIYWQKTGTDENGDSIFLPPSIIACRWDFQEESIERTETVETRNISSTIFPDRILTIGSFLMLGDPAKLDILTDAERSNPVLIQDASMVKTQKVTPEWRYKDMNLFPGLQSDHIMIEVTI